MLQTPDPKNADPEKPLMKAAYYKLHICIRISSIH